MALSDISDVKKVKRLLIAGAHQLLGAKMVSVNFSFAEASRCCTG